MQIVELGTRTPELAAAEKVVAEWLIRTWIERPTWMVRMPDREDVDALINKIAEALEKSACR